MVFKKDPSQIPATSGVYIFKDYLGSVIYVGKAKNIKSRISSYRSLAGKYGDKTTKMVRAAYSLEYIQTLSELEALILESALIKKYRPQFNHILKDDKAYQYILIGKGDYPVIKLGRRNTSPKGASLHGPYPHSAALRQAFKDLRKIFRFRDCSDNKFKKYQRLGRGCLYQDLNLCQAPCVNSHSKGKYQLSVRQLKRFLSGGGEKLRRQWQLQLKSLAKQERFEEAGEITRQIKQLDYVRERSHKPGQYIKNPNLYQDILKKQERRLVRVLSESLQLKIPVEASSGKSAGTHRPMIIEAFDVSNIQEVQAVGAKVSFLGGEPNKSQYRRYRIRSVLGISDVAMLKEVVSRRLKSSKDLPHPHLIVVDGGKPQVGAASAVLEELEVTIPLIGLAKSKETIVAKKGSNQGKYQTINLTKADPALHLLQRLRDEAHRFALNYHQTRRKKEFSGK